LEAAFKFFGEASVAIEPSAGALDNPASEQDDKTTDGIGAFDDLDGPFADLVESGIDLGPAIGAVDKEMPQPRMEIPDRGKDVDAAIERVKAEFDARKFTPRTCKRGGAVQCSGNARGITRRRSTTTTHKSLAFRRSCRRTSLRKH